MSKTLLVIGIVGTILMGIIVFFIGLSYENDVGGHLKRAADANQPATALKELDRALDGMGRRGLDRCDPGECYTSIFYRTPDEDIGFWYQNIESARNDIRSLPADADQLLISNSLMKLRETLLDNTDSGDEVTEPKGISRYPNNGMIGFFLFLFMGMTAGGWIGLLRGPRHRFHLEGFGL